MWADLADDAREARRVAEAGAARRRRAAAAEAEAEAAAGGGADAEAAAGEGGQYRAPSLGYPDGLAAAGAGAAVSRELSGSSAAAAAAAAAAAGGPWLPPPWLARLERDCPVAALALEAARGRPGAAFALWHWLRREVTLRACYEWDDGPAAIRLYRRAAFPALLPLYALLRATIPFVIPPGGSRAWLLAALACWPAFVACYLGLVGSAKAFFAAAAVGSLVAAAAAWLTRRDAPGAPPLSGLLLPPDDGADGADPYNPAAASAAPPPRWAAPLAAAAPGALSVLGFFAGVAWIDTVAGEVVGALSFLAALASFPAGVAGLTLLAWGNSLGDFFGNRAMARAGHASIATTACFAAPLFNMLLSLALGFGGALAKQRAKTIAVKLTPEVALGCAFLITYNAALIAVGRACGGRLPRGFAVFARVWYGLYFLAACASGFGLLRLF